MVYDEVPQHITSENDLFETSLWTFNWKSGDISQTYENPVEFLEI